MAFGCGRLFEGTPSMMWKTLSQFKKLPLDTRIYSGHEYAIKNLEFALSIDSENKDLKKKYVQIKDLIDRNLDMIRNSLYWLVNQIKSWLMGQATQIMNTLGYSVPSPGPGVTKTITEAIMFIIRQIACTFDTSLIDSLFGIIEDAINALKNAAMDIIDSVQCVFDAVFETIFNITDLCLLYTSPSPRDS